MGKSSKVKAEPCSSGGGDAAAGSKRKSKSVKKRSNSITVKPESVKSLVGSLSTKLKTVKEVVVESNSKSGKAKKHSKKPGKIKAEKGSSSGKRDKESKKESKKSKKRDKDDKDGSKKSTKSSRKAKNDQQQSPSYYQPQQQQQNARPFFGNHAKFGKKNKKPEKKKPMEARKMTGLNLPSSSNQPVLIPWMERRFYVPASEMTASPSSAAAALASPLSAHRSTRSSHKNRLRLITDDIPSHVMERFNQEVVAFSLYVQLTDQECQARTHLVENLQTIAKSIFHNNYRNSNRQSYYGPAAARQQQQQPLYEPVVSLQVFGSFATRGVCVYSSDIDLALWGVVAPEAVLMRHSKQLGTHVRFDPENQPPPPQPTSEEQQERMEKERRKQLRKERWKEALALLDAENATVPDDTPLPEHASTTTASQSSAIVIDLVGADEVINLAGEDDVEEDFTHAAGEERIVSVTTTAITTTVQDGSFDRQGLEDLTHKAAEERIVSETTTIQETITPTVEENRCDPFVINRQGQEDLTHKAAEERILSETTATSTAVTSTVDDNQCDLFVIDRQGQDLQDDFVFSPVNEVDNAGEEGEGSSTSALATVDTSSFTDKVNDDVAAKVDRVKDDVKAEEYGKAKHDVKAEEDRVKAEVNDSPRDDVKAEVKEEEGDENHKIPSTPADTDEEDSADKMEAFVLPAQQAFPLQEEKKDDDDEDSVMLASKPAAVDGKTPFTAISLTSESFDSDDEEDDNVGERIYDDDEGDDMQLSIIASFASANAETVNSNNMGPRGRIRVQVVDALRSLRNALRRCPLTHSCTVIERARIPIAKLQTSLGVEMDVAVGGHNGTDTSHFAAMEMEKYQSFSPVVLLLKILLNQQELDTPFNGGLGSYKLYVLVAYHIQQHLLAGGKDQPGEILLSFLFRYGAVPGHKDIPKQARTTLDQDEPLQYTATSVADLSNVYHLEDCVHLFRRCWERLWNHMRAGGSLSSHGSNNGITGTNGTPSSFLQHLIDTERLHCERNEAIRNAVNAVKSWATAERVQSIREKRQQEIQNESQRNRQGAAPSPKRRRISK